MGMALKIRTILLERNMTIKSLAEELGMSGNNMTTSWRGIISRKKNCMTLQRYWGAVMMGFLRIWTVGRKFDDAFLMGGAVRIRR